MPPRRTPRNKGLSLLELLLALALTGFVVAGTAFLLTRPKALVETVSERIDDSILVELQGAKLVERLNRSHPMRRGFFTCEPAAVQTLLGSREAFPGAAFSGKMDLATPFSLAYAVTSTIAGVTTTPNVISVADTSRFPVGSVVLLTALNAPTTGAVRRVREVDAETGQVLLGTTAVTVPKELGCQVKSSLSVGDLVNDPSARVFGQTPTSFAVDVVEIARYETADAPPKGRELRETVWPETKSDDPSATRAATTFARFQGLFIDESAWVPQGAASSSGRFTAVLRVSQDEDPGTGGAPIVRSVRRRIAYDNFTGGQANFGAVTAPQPSDLEFPSCGINLMPVTNQLTRDDKRYARFFRLRPVVADAGITGGMRVRFSGVWKLDPQCWSESQVQHAGGRTQVPGDDGMTGGLTMGVGAALTTAICDFPPGTIVSPTLDYFHPKARRMIQLTCSGATVPGSLPFELEYRGGVRSRCWENGTISFGILQVKGTSPPEPGPAIFVEGKSCRWEHGGWLDCTPVPSRGRLEEVKLYPSHIPGISESFGSDGYEINCAN